MTEPPAAGSKEPPPPGDDQRAAEERQQQLQERQAARDAALARAEQAAAAASAERDAAAARARDALALAARERALAAKVLDDDAVHDGGADDDKSLASDVDNALLFHEAAALLNLHAQAVAVQNIRSLVPFVLDVTSGNYTRWREQFLLTLGKYSLQDHVLHPAPAAPLPDWTRMDCVVKSWIYGSVSAELAETVMDRDAGARVAWLAIEAQFLGNREARALILDARFRAFSQGDLPIADYCRRFKKMADDLGDLGEPVTDRTLVLNVIRGLSERFHDIGTHLRRGRPFPSFADVVSELTMEKLTMANRPSAPPTALVATTPTSTGASRPPPHPAGGGSTPKPPKNKNRRSKRAGQKSSGNGGGSGSGSGGSSASSTGGQWPSLFNPWTGSISMWPGPRPPLAPLPGQQQQALLAQQAHAHAFQQQLLSQQQAQQQQLAQLAQQQQLA